MDTFSIRIAMNSEIDQLDKLEKHFAWEEIQKMVGEGKYYLAFNNNIIVGWLRYGLFWDHIPFMNKLFLVEEYRGKGIGTRLVKYWEAEMRILGHKSTMTSTQVDESAQHFYRKMGYLDIGGFTYPEQALELMMLKRLEE